MLPKKAMGFQRFVIGRKRLLYEQIVKLHILTKKETAYPGQDTLYMFVYRSSGESYLPTAVLFPVKPCFHQFRIK